MSEIKTTREHIDDLMRLMGVANYCIWLTTLDPPLDERPEEIDIRRVLVSKIIELGEGAK